MIHVPSSAITSIDELKKYLQIAIQLEHATLPPYLTAAYSARLEVNKPSIDIIMAVAKEEMLHLAQAANLLSAIGGHPNLKDAAFVPQYPTHLPTGADDFDVGIEPFSERVLRLFLDIERPTSLKPKQSRNVTWISKVVRVSGEQLDRPSVANPNRFVPVTPVGSDQYELNYKIALMPHDRLTARRKANSKAGTSLVPHVGTTDSDENAVALHYWSIGEFYRAIHLGFVELAQEHGESLFSGDVAKQVKTPSYYSAGGTLTMVHDLKTALAAIDSIAGQGEGSNDNIYDADGELAHYYRFDQIHRKRYYRVPTKEPDSGDKPGHPRGESFSVRMNGAYPIKPNAKVADYAGYPVIEQQARRFNGEYKQFLALLHAAFNGQPSLMEAEAGFTNQMFRLGRSMERLIRNPIGGSNANAAPTFEMDQVDDASWSQRDAAVATHA